jgi:hypothetical protein
VVEPPPVVEPAEEPPPLVVPSTIEMSPPSVVEPELLVSPEVSLTGPNFITERVDHTNNEPANVKYIPLSTVVDVCWFSWKSIA